MKNHNLKFVETEFSHKPSYPCTTLPCILYIHTKQKWVIRLMLWPSWYSLDKGVSGSVCFGLNDEKHSNDPTENQIPCCSVYSHLVYWLSYHIPD